MTIQLLLNDSLEYAYCFINVVNCTRVDGWKTSTKVITVATQFVKKWCQWMLQWHCLLY